MAKSASFDKEFSCQKLRSIISLIDRLIGGEYPHPDSNKALERIREIYANELRLLDTLDDAANEDTMLEYCRRANILLVRLKKFLGLTLRSGNIRNAFEIYFPIKVLATEMLGSETCVVLGSEWEFSPFTYPVALPELPQFIFIGLPASECQNPLIMPLAGHELAHVIWRRNGVKEQVDDLLRPTVAKLYKDNWDRFRELFANVPEDKSKFESDLFVQSIWGHSFKLAHRQLEEVFCDFFGVYIFGQAFLHSFRYLLAPSLGRTRVPAYPPLKKRAEYLAEFTKNIGLPEFPEFSSLFSESEPNFSQEREFIQTMADQARDLLYPKLVDFIEKNRGTADPFSSGTKDEATVLQCLTNLIPSATVDSVAAVINAGWEIRLKLDDWKVLENIDDQDERKEEKIRVLSDLILKSLEIYEYRKRVEHAA